MEVFITKYNEFCDELILTYTEKSAEITLAKGLSDEVKFQRYCDEIAGLSSDFLKVLMTRVPEQCPGVILPGVTVDLSTWDTFSKSTQEAITQYVSVLSVQCIVNCKKDLQSEYYKNMKESNKESKETNEGLPDFLKDMMGGFKEKMESLDFKSLIDKMKGLFGADAEGNPTNPIPEKFLKGHLGKLVNELVNEFKPEDFGFTPEEVKSLESNPSRSFEVIMKIYKDKPELLQNAMKKVLKRFQHKFASGEINPAKIRAEAEEMMKEFTDNPAFVELMESFRDAFGFADGKEKEAGRDGSARLSLARARLRAKLDKRNGNGNGNGNVKK